MTLAVETRQEKTKQKKQLSNEKQVHLNKIACNSMNPKEKQQHLIIYKNFRFFQIYNRRTCISTEKNNTAKIVIRDCGIFVQHLDISRQKSDSCTS